MALNGIAHKELTDPQLHDLKGVSSATEGQVPFANDAGASEWRFIGPSDIKVESVSEVDEASSNSSTAPAALVITGLSGTVDGSCADASTFTDTNTNVKELATKLNALITYTSFLQTSYNDLVTKFNALQDILDNLGFISIRS